MSNKSNEMSEEEYLVLLEERQKELAERRSRRTGLHITEVNNGYQEQQILPENELPRTSKVSFSDSPPAVVAGSDFHKLANKLTQQKSK